MKLAFLGDIHGNDLAFEAVLNSIKAHKVDKLLITGDFVGYYFNPKRVLDLLIGWDFVAVKGNHEYMLELCLNDSKNLVNLEKKYGTGLRLALDTLSENQIRFLINLPISLKINIDDTNLLLCHGAPNDCRKYIYPDTDLQSIPKELIRGSNVIVLGHTHYRMNRLHEGSITFINPGSVGQPRDKISGASWALYDTIRKTVEIKNESYDVGMVKEEAKKRHPEIPYLGNILERH